MLELGEPPILSQSHPFPHIYTNPKTNTRHAHSLRSWLTSRDPRFIREFKAKHCVEMMVEHVVQKKK